MGGIGGLMGLGGSILGQLGTNGGCWNLINWKSVGVAGLTGAASGALLPVVGTSLVGAGGLGSASSVAQYGLTQWVNNEPTTRGGIFLSIGIGGLAGIAAGAFDAQFLKGANSRLLPFWWEGGDPRYDVQMANQIMSNLYTSNVTVGTLSRAGGAAAASNVDYLNINTSRCSCSK